VLIDVSMAEALVHSLFESDARGLDALLEVIYSYAHFISAEELMVCHSPSSVLTDFVGSSSVSFPRPLESSQLVVPKHVEPRRDYLIAHHQLHQKLDQGRATQIPDQHNAGYVFVVDACSSVATKLKEFLEQVPPQWALVIERALTDQDEQADSEEDLPAHTPRMLLLSFSIIIMLSVLG
jgi:hypothetical protein